MSESDGIRTFVSGIRPRASASGVNRSRALMAIRLLKVGPCPAPTFTKPRLPNDRY